jgi:subfamily B ATP-binding cassette protein MsbA
MEDALKILRFGRTYLRHYWFRFVAGIVFGVLFGLSNGLTMGSVYLMLGRLGDSAHVRQVTAQAKQDAAQTKLAAAQAKLDDENARLAATKAALDAEQQNLSEERSKLEAAQSAAQESPWLHSFHSFTGHLYSVTDPWTRSFHAFTKEWTERLYLAVDPWLPLSGRSLDWKQIFGGLLLFPLVSLIRGVTGYATTYCMAWAGQRISNDVKEDVFRKINTLSLDFFHQHTTAELMSRINDDTGALNSCLRLGLSDLVKEPATIFTLFATLLLIDWKLTVLAMIFAPLCIVPTRIISRRIKAQGRQDNVAYVQQAGVAMESFQNVRVTKAYDLAPEQTRLFRKAGDRASHFIIKTVQARAMLNPIVETLNAFGMGAVLIYAIWSGIGVKVLGAFLFALLSFYQPFKKLSTIQVYFTQAGLAVERLMGIFQVEPTVREPVTPRELPHFHEALEFRHVGFSYGDGPVLDNISIAIPHGTRLGLAGESGSGKSSLLNLLFRFYDPIAGEITLDGVSIDAFRLADLRSRMALVSQDVLLFNTTVAENIGYGKRGATREEIVAAAKEAYAHEFISALPAGYDTPLGERGLRLSGGQRQRIAIARAFIRNAPILVLDEATASLDSQAEAEVQRAIDHLVENRTVICVAHRLSTLRGMDRIVVLQQGRIVESGRFEELLARQGLFTAMAARQSIFPQAAAV